MCHTGSYLCGMGAGLVVGAIISAAILSQPNAGKTTMGKAMHRVGTAVDQAVESVSDMM